MQILQSPSNGYQTPIGATTGYTNPIFASYLAQNQQAQQNNASGNFSLPHLPFSSGNSLFSGISTGINNAAANAFPSIFAPSTAGIGGYSLPAVAGEAPVTIAEGASVPSAAGATLTGTLGAAGLGALAGSYLGKIGGNSTGGSIGGGLGAGAMALAGFGPVGIIAGGLLGGIGGGFFGNKKPSDKTQVGVINLNDGTTDSEANNKVSAQGAKFSQQNAQARDAVSTGAANYAKYLVDNGATPINPGTQVVVQVGSRDGLRYVIGDKVTNAGADYKKYSSLLYGGIDSQYNIPDSLKQKLANMNREDISNFGQANPSGQPGGLSMKIPVVAGKLSFDEFMKAQKANANVAAPR